MVNRLPVRRTVGFRDVNWEVEEEKTQQGFERRKKAQQRRAQRKDSRRMAKMLDKQLQSFLRFEVSNGENASQILSMDTCDVVLQQAIKTEDVTFRDDGTKAEKVQLLLELFDSLKDNKVVRPFMDGWMNTAVHDSLYSVLPDDVPDDGSPQYSASSSVRSKPSNDEASQASELTAGVDIDMNIVTELRQAISLLEEKEFVFEKHLNVMNFLSKNMSVTSETAQVHVNEIIKEIQALVLKHDDSLLRDRAIALFETETKQTPKSDSAIFSWLCMLIIPLRRFWTTALLMSSLGPHMLPELALPATRDASLASKL